MNNYVSVSMFFIRKISFTIYFHVIISSYLQYAIISDFGILCNQEKLFAMKAALCSLRGSEEYRMNMPLIMEDQLVAYTETIVIDNMSCNIF